MYDHIKAEDSEVYSAIMQEIGRQRNKIELIAFLKLQVHLSQTSMQKVTRESVITADVSMWIS